MVRDDAHPRHGTFAGSRISLIFSGSVKAPNRARAACQSLGYISSRKIHEPANRYPPTAPHTSAVNRTQGTLPSSSTDGIGERPVCPSF